MSEPPAPCLRHPRAAPLSFHRQAAAGSFIIRNSSFASEREVKTVHRFNRRELLQRTGALAAATTLGFGANLNVAGSAAADPLNPSFEWIRSARLLIAEGYVPPFYPTLDYDAERALSLARRLNCDSIRYPTYSYVAFFPTRTKFPRHPELGSRDPFRRTVELFHDAGMRVAAYNPLNHPFMDIAHPLPEYRDWMRYGVHGHPFITGHMGWTRFYEGCLNSPLRDQIRERVHEVVTNYPVDLMYFDGPYQGMEHQEAFCHCKYCTAAYRKARGKGIPLQDASTTLDEEIEYRQWLSNDVVDAFMREICDMVRQARAVPIVYNDTELIGNGWRSRAYPPVDGFMFEAAETPEQKLFNMRVGQSTGKVIWTYVSSYQEYNCEHLKDKTKRGWYSYPVAGERLLLDAAVATAAGVGYCYWGLNRVFFAPEEVLDEPSIRSLAAIFGFARKNQQLLGSLRPAPQAAIMTGTQTMGWLRDPLFIPRAYRNYYYGAWQLLKDLGYDAAPFLDYRITPDQLAKYPLVYAPNCACLSNTQCSALADYVTAGGTLLATHLTSIADEYGRPRKNYGLSEMFGATAAAPQPIEIPDLYLRLLPSKKLIPQDPQVMRFTAAPDAEVLAETFGRGRRRTLGPAIIRRRHRKGTVIYIGSGLEAIYAETLHETLRSYFKSLLDPILGPSRAYEAEFRPGLMHEFARSENTLVLHLLANTGNIWKKSLVQEHFMPLRNVRARLRLPPGRSVKSVALAWSGAAPQWRVENGWVEVVVPKVQVYEAIVVELA